MNNSCDAVRSIGDSCTTNLQCGSVCNNNQCALGSVNDKCNGDQSCASSFCATNNNTCQIDTRGRCSVSNPYGLCNESSSICYEGKCYSTNSDEGAACNSSLPFPQCEVTLACISSTCVQVAEGTPCSDRSVCSLVQDCLCSGGGATSVYGCYTKIGMSCAVAYQALENCLSNCTEWESDGVPNTCANKCHPLKMKYACCEGCSIGSTFFNAKGTCPSLVALPCCSSSVACAELPNKAVCEVNSIFPIHTNSGPSICRNAWIFVGLLAVGLLMH